MTRLPLAVSAAWLVLGLASAPAMAQPESPTSGHTGDMAPGGDKAASRANQCFFVNQFQDWRDVDDKTLYFRLDTGAYYRLDMAQSCPALTYPQPRLDTVTRGPDTVCSAVDWDLRVANGSSPGGFSEPCIVKKMTRLTPAEAAAIPKKYKPN